MKGYPEEILKEMYEECLRQKTMTPENATETYFNKKGCAFSWEFSDIKYGYTGQKRVDFWYEIVVENNYEKFFKLFPKHQKIIIDGQEFII